MKYILKYKGGGETVCETDLKPSKSIKCRSCEGIVALNPDNSENVFGYSK